MSNDLKSNGEHAGGANNDFQKFAAGDGADKVLSAAYQNKLIAGVERANRKTYGQGVIDFGPVSLSKGGRHPHESGNRIRVRLDYPYRAPLGAAVGIDFPVLDERIQTAQDVVNFLEDPSTVYSCTKNQYRHHNRWGILEQELLPGQEGWAVVSGVAKTFWHGQRPIHAESGVSQGVHDSIDEVPASTTNAAIDDYKQLGILAADFSSGGSYSSIAYNNGDEFGFGSSGGDVVWKNRFRPWWLAPYNRVRRQEETGDKIGAEIYYPYSQNEYPIASSRGRATSVGGHAVPEPSCAGTSTVKCVGGHYRVISSTCETGCSSWFAIENYSVAEHYGIDTPCTEGNEVSNIPCISDYPYADVDWTNISEYSKLAASGAWISRNSVEFGWIAGTVILGTPESFANSDGEYRIANTLDDDNATSELDPSVLPSPYGFITDAEAWGNIARSCANLTCTYTCNGTDWILSRGEEPYNLDENWRCKCPTDWLIMMSSHDIPCNAMSQPREITLGMVYSHVDTTTSTSSTSSTTTTTCSTSSQCGMSCVLGNNPSDPIHPQYMWSISGCHAHLSDCSCAYDSITSIPSGLACNPSGGMGPDYGAINCGDDPPEVGACCGIGSDCIQCAIVTSDMCGGLGGEYQGDGTTCSDCSVPVFGACCFTIPGAGILGSDLTACRGTTECGCAKTDEIYPTAIGMTYLGDGTSCGSGDCTSTTTTTSSTTTTTAGSSTTTSSTTTTTAATGACCFDFGDLRSCAVMSQYDCENNLPFPNPIYQGDGTICTPNPCV